MSEPTLFESKPPEIQFELITNSVPVWPIFIPSRGRADTGKAASLLWDAGIPFNLVVEPREEAVYIQHWEENHVLCLPMNDMGIAYARQWIKAYAASQGHKWHWQIDDDVRRFQTRDPSETIDPGEALCSAECLALEYANVGAVGFAAMAWPSEHEVVINQQVYTCFAIQSHTPHEFHGGCVEDTDFNLQILDAGACTLLIKKVRALTPATSSQAGGNTGIEYEGAGRERRSEGLVRRWPQFNLKITGEGLSARPRTQHLWRQFKQRPIEWADTSP